MVTDILPDKDPGFEAMLIILLIAGQLPGIITVSYTHLDVYKRQKLIIENEVSMKNWLMKAKI